MGIRWWYQGIRSHWLQAGDYLVDDKANECFKNGLFLSYAQIQPKIGVTCAELMRKDKQLSEEIKCLRREKSDALIDIEEQAEVVQIDWQS